MSNSAWLAVGIVCLSACGTDPDGSDHCPNGMAIVVQPAAEPEFAWTPSSCFASSIVVDGPDGEHWALFATDGVNSIRSPVRYGQPPSAGRSERPNAGGGGPPLTPGTGYNVSLRRFEGGEERLAGVQSFVQSVEP